MVGSLSMQQKNIGEYGAKGQGGFSPGSGCADQISVSRRLNEKKETF